MAKTKLTEKLENNIFKYASKHKWFCCPEVTIGFGGRERVDYMTMDTKNVFRCFEVKVSKADFYSKCKHSFVGNFNYFVMPNELYEKVKQDIPDNIGVFDESMDCIRKPKRQELKVDMDVLKSSMIRSLNREFVNRYKSENVRHVNGLKSKISRLERSYNSEHNDNIHMSNMVDYMCKKLNCRRSNIWDEMKKEGWV